MEVLVAGDEDVSYIGLTGSENTRICTLNFTSDDAGRCPLTVVLSLALVFQRVRCIPTEAPTPLHSIPELAACDLSIALHKDIRRLALSEGLLGANSYGCS